MKNIMVLSFVELIFFFQIGNILLYIYAFSENELNVSYAEFGHKKLGFTKSSKCQQLILHAEFYANKQN